ncbi:MAG: hypothetical protein CMJ88_10535 [Planctomycetes bacterium]|nr:hypothetical protein [Planctomycetota bacterium]
MQRLGHSTTPGEFDGEDGAARTAATNTSSKVRFCLTMLRTWPPAAATAAKIGPVDPASSSGN